MQPTSVEAAGLTSGEAAHLLNVWGPNRPPTAPPRRVFGRVWTQVSDPMILLLIAAGALTSALHDFSDTAIIAAVVVFNTATGVVQEVRADRAVAALRTMVAPVADVVRDGERRRVAAEELVPGDLLLLSAGEIVPADAVLHDAHMLQLDESAMTGESVPVDRDDGDEVTGGTLVTRGNATATVLRTGAHSGLGRIAAMMAATPRRLTPLQRRLADLSRWLVGAVLALTAVVVVLGILNQRPVSEMAVVGVSLAVAAVPESLPAVVTIALALGARRMARRDAVVRGLPAVETLGSVTVIATDKTGTLTEGRMVAEELWLPEPGTGNLRRPLPTPVGNPSLERFLRDVALCNDAERSGPDRVLGDPMDRALLLLAEESGVDVDGWARIRELPFDAGRRRMTTVHRHRDGSILTVCKGAPEIVLGLVRPGPEVGLASERAEELAGEGYRVLAVADRTDGDATEEVDESGLQLVGLVAIEDPPRSHARAVVEACHRAGIRLLLVTGDHQGTADAIAARVGIRPGTDATVDGRGPVFARVRPEQKVGIVEALQRRGEVVAMLGDGVNDAPALRRADIGVAAGRGGTEVARQAADLVLLDDDFSTVVAAVEEGRRVFANIRSFLLYAVSGGLAEVGVMLVGPAIGIADPLLAAQILWINLMTHGLTGVAFGAQPLDPAEMSRPPRPMTGSVFTGRAAVLLALIAMLLVATALVVSIGVSDVAEQRTRIFLTLGLGQLAVAWAIRSRRRGAPLSTRGLPMMIVVAAGLMLLGTQADLLHPLLGTVALSWPVVTTAVLAALIPAVIVSGILRVPAFGFRTGR